MLSHDETGRGSVRCADCRFLRVQERDALLEPDSAYRIGGGSVTGPIGAPVCLKEQCPLTDEFESATGPFSERVLKVLWMSRNCPDFRVAGEVSPG